MRLYFSATPQYRLADLENGARMSFDIAPPTPPRIPSAAACLFVLAACLMVLFSVIAEAKPLDAEACARLKQQRDALEATGVRSAMTERPPAKPQKTLDEKAQGITTLIKLDGQLRFRCHMELPITSLKPELLLEVPDTVDGDGQPKPPAVKRPAAKRPKPTDPAALAAPTTGSSTGTPVPARPKTATVGKAKTVDSAPAPTAEIPAPKPRPKPRPKTDDAYQPPTKTESMPSPQ